ncbi:MAG: hypothetical protein COA78_24005 [Blastopirellula sp.]|nr:MAG: hypothetical protein COA78_24005 [Blastopirellula sp.]
MRQSEIDSASFEDDKTTQSDLNYLCITTVILWGLFSAPFFVAAMLIWNSPDYWLLARVLIVPIGLIFIGMIFQSINEYDAATEKIADPTVIIGLQCVLYIGVAAMQIWSDEPEIAWVFGALFGVGFALIQFVYIFISVATGQRIFWGIWLGMVVSIYMSIDSAMRFLSS